MFDSDGSKPMPAVSLAFVGEVGPLFEALAKAQGEFPVLAKSRTVQVRSDKGSYSFDYATLDDLQQAVRGPLAKHGLCLLQPFYGPHGGKELRTILGHSSGARIEATISIADAPNVQALGSQLTYLKRYALKSLLCINDGEDDDGAQATGHQAQVAPREAPKGPQRTPPQPPQGTPAKREAPKVAPPKVEPAPAAVVAAPPPSDPAPSPEAEAAAAEEAPPAPPADGPITKETFDAIRGTATIRLRRSNGALQELYVRHTLGRYTGGDPRGIVTEAEGQAVLEHLRSMSDADANALIAKHQKGA